jgi:hypothetical protein
MRNDEYIKKLERRIHNQRVALRENWMITEMRMKERASPCYRPLKSKWLEYVKKQNKIIRELRRRLGEI